MQRAMEVGVLALLWAVLAQGDPASWWVGVPTIAAAWWLRHALQPAGERAVSWLGLVRFLPLFAILSLQGGWDVARRALGWPLDIAPAIERYPLRLPPGTARVFFMNVVSLLPGTLSADLDGETLIVHVLDRRLDNGGPMRALEERIAGVFGVGTLAPAAERGGA